MTRTGTTYRGDGTVSQWTITEPSPRCYLVTVDGVKHSLGGVGVVRRFLASQ